MSQARETIRMGEEVKVDGAAASLARLAAKYVWWLTPEKSVNNPRRLIAQVMNLGTWDDVVVLEAVVPRHALEDALRHALPGWFSGPSWALWHLRLGLAAADTIPPLPKRTFT